MKETSFVDHINRILRHLISYGSKDRRGVLIIQRCSPENAPILSIRSMHHVQLKSQSAKVFALKVGNVREIVWKVFDGDVNSCSVGREEGVRKVQ